MHGPRVLMGFLMVVAILVLSACGGAPEAPTVAPTIAATATLPTPTAVPQQSAEPTDTVAGASDTGQKFTSADGAFSVQFPGSPTESSSTANTDLGAVAIHTFSYADPNGIAYTVSYNDYPADKVPSDSAQLLSGAVAGIGKSSTLTNQQNTTQQGHPAILAEFDASGSNHLFYKGTVVQNRLYQIIAVTTTAGEETYRPDAMKFLDSFELTENR